MKFRSRKHPLKKKKGKRTLMTFPMAKTPSSQLTFIAQDEIQVQEASPKEKKGKRTLMTFSMAKTPSSQLTFIAQAEIQVQKASPKEKKGKRTLMTFTMTKKEHYPAYLHSPS